MEPSPYTLMIPPDLWTRLRRIDGRCTIQMYRTKPYNERLFPTAKKTWQVTISLEPGFAHEYFRMEHPTLAEALRQAVEEGERRGWDKPLAVA